MELDKRPIYYVYEWYNVDTGEVFYVGKGRGNRYKYNCRTSRNQAFYDYYINNKCAVRKILENVIEEDACNLEDKRIKELDAIGQAKCNIRKCTTHRGYLEGEANPFYRKKHTPEVIQYLKEINIGKFAGDKNPQYGISPKDRMTPEVYARWRQEQIDNKIRGKNGRAAKVYAIKDGEVKEFACVLDCAEFIRSFNPDIKGTIDTTRSRISECIRRGLEYKGYRYSLSPDNKDFGVQKFKCALNLDKDLVDKAKNYCSKQKIYLNAFINELIKSYMNNRFRLSSIERSIERLSTTFRSEIAIGKFLQDEARDRKLTNSEFVNSLLYTFFSKEE